MDIREQDRINAVKRFEHFDFDLNRNLHGVLRLATDIYEAPAAFITLIDEHDQWFKVNKGFDVLRMPRETSFCTHTIRQSNALIVSDTQKDKRFANNPFVYSVPNIRFYAGAPLCTNDGNNIGTICVMDTIPKEIPENKRQLLEILARQVIHLMELELAHKLLREKMQHIECQNRALTDIARIQSHDIRGPLTSIMGLMNMIKDDEYRSPKAYLQLMETAVATLDEKIHSVVQSASIGDPA